MIIRTSNSVKHCNIFQRNTTTTILLVPTVVWVWPFKNVIKQLVPFEFDLCNINRLDIPEEFNRIWILSQQNTLIICLNCQDMFGRGLNQQPSADESNVLPLSYLDWYGWWARYIKCSQLTLYIMLGMYVCYVT